MSTISTTRLLELLNEERRGAAVMAFDGDGTLWSGDVAEDVFDVAVERGLIREDAHAELLASARAHGVDARGTPSELAGRIFRAYQEGRFPEREVCEVMTWCFAGWSVAELERFAREALTELRLAERFSPSLDGVLAWAHEAEVRVVIVSASPQSIVEQAAHLRGIAAENVSAGMPELDGATILPKMASPIPYGADKLRAAERFFRDGAQWLASFEDSLFDLELLKAARLGVAVRPKPELREKIERLRSGYVLSE